ncbi:hypothetical protein L1080_003300 [Rhodococcus sp. MSC1_016]|jgi:hypothetical protein|uniref:hypothetical protein n=1 Tax=Rhodococcus sp. MSC1_016 TaxID=2909266 RepID=UPI00202EC109|nr:hypothetical protein [Rhodococcus sp. MSC1_016]
MAERTIWHAIFEWFEDGVRHFAYRGEVVDIPQDVIDQYEKFGVFDAPPEPQPDLAETAEEAPVDGKDLGDANPGGDADESTGDGDLGAPVRPKRAALAKDWEDYVVALHEFTDGKDGLPRAEAEAATREALIAQFGTK